MSGTAEEEIVKKDPNEEVDENEEGFESENEDEGSGDQDQDENEAGEESEEEGEKAESGESEGEESEDVDIVREGKGSQPSRKTRSFSDRINKLNRKTKAAEDKAGEKSQEVELLKEKYKLLELSLEQEKEKSNKPVKPQPDDYHGGISDEKYIQDKEKYDDYIIDQKVEARFSKISQAQQGIAEKSVQAQDTLKVRTAHYDRVEKMGMKTYRDAEDKAIEYLGEDLVDDIIENIEESHILIGFLGKNEDEAILIREKIKKKPAQGLIEMGKLAAQLTVKPKSRKVPNPDSEVSGSSGSKVKSFAGPKGATFS